MVGMFTTVSWKEERDPSRGLVIAFQSGGMDSPPLTYKLARDYPEYDFLPLYIRSKLSPAYWYREEGCNQKIWDLNEHKFSNVFEPTAYEHPEVRVSRSRTQRRNQIYLKHFTQRIQEGIFGDNVVGFSMGVVPAAEMGLRWVHGWTTFDDDHKPEFLQARLKEWAPNLRLWSFADFGMHMEHRDERCKLFLELLGEESLFVSTSCQLWYSGKTTGKTGGCGFCHSCQARAVAIQKVMGYDKTPYRNDPVKGKSYPQYVIAEQYVEGVIKALEHSTSKGYWNGLDIKSVLRQWMLKKLNALSNGATSDTTVVQ